MKTNRADIGEGPRYAVLGGGAWGTALALRLAANAAMVSLWFRDPIKAEQCALRRENRPYLPGVHLPESIIPVGDLTAALAGADGVVVATPVVAFGHSLGAIVRHCCCAHVISACKGFGEEGRLLSEVAADSGIGLTVISGPTFAAEIAAGSPAAAVIASARLGDVAFWKHAFHAETFRCYTSTDVCGVEVGGACKNIIAIAAGISDGLQLGANSRAAVITRGMHEMQRLGRCLGAQEWTLQGLAGMGDLVLTATDEQSRNLRYGKALAHGRGLGGAVVEGVLAAERVGVVAARFNLQLPICDAVLAVIRGVMSAQQAVDQLLRRPAGAEFDDL